MEFTFASESYSETEIIRPIETTKMNEMNKVYTYYSRTETSFENPEPDRLDLLSEVIGWIAAVLSVFALMCLHGWLSSHRLNSNLVATV